MYEFNSLIISENTMGGFGSGRSGGKLRCESTLSIDVRDWQRRGYLENVGGKFMWQWNRDGKRIFSIQVGVDAHALMLSY